MFSEETFKNRRTADTDECRAPNKTKSSTTPVDKTHIHTTYLEINFKYLLPKSELKVMYKQAFEERL